MIWLFTGHSLHRSGCWQQGVSWTAEMENPDPTPEPMTFSKRLIPAIVFAITFYMPGWYWIAGQQRNVAPTQVYESQGTIPARYESPDKSIVAMVFPVGKPWIRSYESRVEVRSKSGRLLAQRDYTSPDGQHGYGVGKAAWTPDSNFFVFILANSGGHQPWHSPVDFFSRSLNKIFSLDDALHGAVTNNRFSVTAPDGVTVKLYFTEVTTTVSLSALIPKE